ncbi:hypothetical protein Tco_1312642 [Tanacetum coccineum]
MEVSTIRSVVEFPTGTRVAMVKSDYPGRDVSLTATVEERNIRKITWEPILRDTPKELEENENTIRTPGDYCRPSHEGYRNTIELLDGNNVVPLRSDTIRRTIDQSAGGKLRDKNVKESLELLEDLALYDNESWNDLRDFARPVKEISLPQDVPSTFDRRLIEFENQVQRLMEAHLALNPPVQVNKIALSCEICSDPHDTQYCLEIPSKHYDDKCILLT